MARPLRVLCVHGVGNHQDDLSWQDDWKGTITEAVRESDASRVVDFDFVLYDHLFADDPPGPRETLIAAALLLGSGITTGLGGLFRRQRGALGDLPGNLRWTAGMVVQWVQNAGLRAETRDLLLGRMEAFAPHVVCGHSLGSLVCYDAFVQADGLSAAQRKAVRAAAFVSLGSQIGNAFVRGRWLGGRVVPLEVRRWYHLYNPNDRAFTSPLQIDADNFEQVETAFGDWGDRDVVNHDAVSYFSHENAVSRVWADLAADRDTRALRVQARAPAPRKPNRRALLVGINEYPDPRNRLEGCVNDVFLASAVLQETRFKPEEIRIVLDRRATAQGIRERMAWLLEEVRDGDERVFFYSGHGAQLPVYNADETVDGLDECLVPYDFDGSPENTITDDWLHELYSQLPYKANFVMILDCCHSGGMSRVSGPRVRTVELPDDIRHRALRWAPEEGMWVPRDFEPLIPLEDRRKSQWDPTDYLGKNLDTRRLGRAVDLRRLPDPEFDDAKEELGHRGPYLPVIFQACQEDQLASEYTHGSVSYGAFTYCLAKILRDAGQAGITFQKLCTRTAEVLKRLGYDQEPYLLGPGKIVRSRVPWTGRDARAGANGAARPRRAKKPAAAAKG